MTKLEEMEPDELYDELDRISVQKARLPQSRDQYTAYTRRYWNDRRREVEAELRRRKLPTRRPGSNRVYGTAAHIAVKNAAA